MGLYGSNLWDVYKPASSRIKGFRLLNPEDAGDLEQRAEHLGKVEAFGQIGLLEGFGRDLIYILTRRGSVSYEEKARRALRRQGIRKGANVAVITRAGIFSDETSDYACLEADLYKV